MSHNWAEPSNRPSLLITPRGSSSGGAARALATTNPMGASHWRRTVDEFVAETLVMALAVIVLDKLADRPSQVALPKALAH